MLGTIIHCSYHVRTEGLTAPNDTKIAPLSLAVSRGAIMRTRSLATFTARPRAPSSVFQEAINCCSFFPPEKALYTA